MSILKLRNNFRPFDYPQAFKFMNDQLNNHWIPDEIEVNSDLLEYKTSFTPAERHGINTVLKLFTTYEINVSDYWIDVVYKWFPVPEIRMMASTFSSMEAVHATFYDKLNEAIGLSTKKFYLSFLEEPIMKKRMDTIKKYLTVKSKNDLPLSLAVFSFVEGVVLYSSFAFLLSFQKEPKNKLSNICTGLAFSTKDEQLHASADSWLFNTLVREEGINVKTDLMPKIHEIANEFFLLESSIIDEIFSKGEILGIDPENLKRFVKSRINKKLKDMKMLQLYPKKEYDNNIEEWFFSMINGVEFTDFFSNNSTAYQNKYNFNKIKSW